MKTHFHYLFFIFLLLSTHSFAQRFYTNFSVGYAMPLSSGNELIVDGFPLTGSGFTYPVNEKYSLGNASLFTGITGNIKAGYHVSGGIAIEAGLVGGIATKKHIYQTETNLHTKETIYAKMPVMFCPSIAYSRSKTGRSLYGSVGICMPLSKKIYTITESQSKDQTDFYDKTEMTTKFSVGFTGTLGYKLPINKMFYVFGELSFLNISFLTKQSNLLESKADGESILDTRYESQKQVNYEKGHDRTMDVYDPGKAMTISAYRMPFSNYGINIGFGINY